MVSYVKIDGIFPQITLGLDIIWPRRIKWDETTVFTTLAPGGGQPVRSCWSVMQVREWVRIVWADGQVLEFPVVSQLGLFMLCVLF